MSLADGDDIPGIILPPPPPAADEEVGDVKKALPRTGFDLATSESLPPAPTLPSPPIRFAIWLPPAAPVVVVVAVVVAAVAVPL